MPGVARKDDMAGDRIQAALAPTVRVNGRGVAVVGDAVKSHGTHTSVRMQRGSFDVLAHGLFVCRQADAASCGHVVSTYSNDVKANG